MSIEIIKEQIDKFLNTDTPEVMVIKGKWGIGKTFSWNKFLRDAKNKYRIKLDKYSYVSLFGINSLEAFKFSIFENIINRSMIGSDVTLETFKSNADDLLKSLGRKSLQLIQGITFVQNFTPAIESASFLSIRSSIICIDDFERKGEGLSVKDVMGLISVLKEQKKCKVVLIHNDGELKGSDLEEYNTYREKVIDFELEFAPTAEDCAEIALSNTDTISRKLGAHSIKLGINNIRIIKKIERLARIIRPLLDQFEDEVANQALHSLTLFAWCFYSKDEDVPTFTYVKNIENMLFGLGSVDDETEEQKKWNTILRNYDYLNTDEFDLQIAQAVETGYINERLLLTEAKKLNDNILASKSENSFREAWQLYHDSFDDNQDEVINGLHQSFQKNVKHISPTNLNGTVKLFRYLCRDDLADEIIDLYVNDRKDEEGLFDLKNMAFAEEITDKRVIDEFNKAHKSTRVERTIKDVLSKIAGRDSWGGDDEDVLSKASADDYYELFKGEKGRHLRSYVDTCLRFGRFANPSEKGLKISQSATEALKRIASESEINKRRVSKFGIQVEEKKEK